MDALLHEERSIQDHLTAGPHSTSEAQLAQTFAKLMFQGNDKPALHILTRHGRAGKLNLDGLVPVSSTGREQRTVHDILIDKHPAEKPYEPSGVAKSDTCSQAPHPVMYQKNSGPVILSVSLITEMLLGPQALPESRRMQKNGSISCLLSRKN